jgi:hypothetical protein
VRTGDIVHAIQVFEGKFELFCKSQYGIHFKVSPASNQTEQRKDGEGTSSSSRTRNNPIDVDAPEQPSAYSLDEELDEKSQAKAEG